MKVRDPRGVERDVEDLSFGELISLELSLQFPRSPHDDMASPQFRGFIGFTCRRCGVKANVAVGDSFYCRCPRCGVMFMWPKPPPPIHEEPDCGFPADEIRHAFATVDKLFGKPQGD